MIKFLFLFAVLFHFGNYAHSDTRDEIVRAVDPWTVGKRNSKPSRPFANQIINGLYLGNDEKFAETLGFECRNNAGKKIDSSNPHKFEVIISLCTYARMVKEMPDLKQYEPKTVEKSFKEKGVLWLQMGLSLPDDKEAWADLVFNATFPDSDLAKKEMDIPKNSKKSEHIKFRAQKKKAVAKLQIDKWFEPTFKIMDQAVHGGTKTLIHCHAGASRSPTLVAAYLINRYQVSAEQAIAFLRSKRNCSNPKCVEDLKAYAAALKKIRQ